MDENAQAFIKKLISITVELIGAFFNFLIDFYPFCAFPIGALLLIPKLYAVSQNKRHSASAKGRVISVETVEKKRRFGKKRHYYVPLVSYTVNDREYTAKYGRSSDSDEFYAGDDLWVMYNPKNPDRVRQEDDAKTIAANIKAGIGVFFIVTSLISLL